MHRVTLRGNGDVVNLESARTTHVSTAAFAPVVGPVSVTGGGVVERGNYEGLPAVTVGNGY